KTSSASASSTRRRRAARSSSPESNEGMMGGQDEDATNHCSGRAGHGHLRADPPRADPHLGRDRRGGAGPASEELDAHSRRLNDQYKTAAAGYASSRATRVSPQRLRNRSGRNSL